MKIEIDASIKDKTKDFALGVLTFDALVENSQGLDPLIAEVEQEIHCEYSLESLLQTGGILEARNAYKAYGKDPSRYRLAVESLFRRIIKGNKLYRINNLVDIGNYVSLKIKKSTAVLDADKVKGDVLIRLGKEEPYQGIARGHINVKNIPVYVDELGPFGSTTSDTPRTMIQEDTSHILMFLISFEGREVLKKDLEWTKELLKSYTSASKIETWIVD